MITGAVSGRHALVRLFVYGQNGQQGEGEFVLDTGFAGFLTLPPASVSALALAFSHRLSAQLADGSRIMLEVYRITIVWDGAQRDVEVLAMDGEALLGKSLLDGSDVRLQVKDGGLVMIEPI